MQLNEFIESLEAPEPQLKDKYLRALWHSGKGDWHRAHHIAQDIHDPHGSWIHAHLHREEGDEWNANYWYRRAGQKMPAITIRQEWEELVTFFLHNS